MVCGNALSAIKTHEHMRIVQKVFISKTEFGTFETKVTQVKGLRLRELVLVRRVKGDHTPKAPCSSENTRIR